MAELQNYWFYHGTTLRDAKLIILNGFKISNKIGSLGYGAYAFANSINDAKTLALRKCKRIRRFTNKRGSNVTPCIIKFKLKYPKLILDFTDPKAIDLYERYTETHRKKLKILASKYKNATLRNNKLQSKIKRLDGAVINIFMEYLNTRTDADFLGIYNLTQNDLYGQVVPLSQIPNSMELNIRSNKVINSLTLNLLHI